jgi:hypothetical protein
MGLLAGHAVQTGRLERANPLPPGQYWIDIFAPKQAAWDAWLAKAGASVHVAVTEQYEGDEEAGYPSRTWYQFDVLSPVQWGNPLAVELGWPNIDKVTPKSSDDTVTKPSLDAFGNVDEPGEPSEWGWVKWAVGGTIVVAGLYSVARLVRG